MSSNSTIERAIADIETRLRDVRTQRAELDKEAGLLEDALRSLGALSGKSSTASAQTGKRTQGVKVTVEDILRGSAGQRLHADQVLAEVTNRGLQVSAADPKATVVTALIRLARERGEQNREGVWKLPRNYWVWSATEPPDHVAPGRHGGAAVGRSREETRALLRPA